MTTFRIKDGELILFLLFKSFLFSILISLSLFLFLNLVKKEQCDITCDSDCHNVI